jgi:hypothetical protein
MLYSKGSLKSIIDNEVIEDKSWELKSLNDHDINLKLKLNGTEYEIRDFTMNDLGTLLNAPHTMEESSPMDFKKPILLTPYPKYSYKKTRKIKSNIKNKNKIIKLTPKSHKCSSLKKHNDKSSGKRSDKSSGKRSDKSSGKRSGKCSRRTSSKNRKRMKSLLHKKVNTTSNHVNNKTIY